VVEGAVSESVGYARWEATSLQGCAGNAMLVGLGWWGMVGGDVDEAVDVLRRLKGSENARSGVM